MDEEYWDRVAPNYNNEIFDVFAMNRNQVLQKYISKNKNTSGIALDLGCGTGKAFQYLTKSFRKIYAVDISADCLNEAKIQGSKFKNIVIGKADLTEKVKLPKADFAICCNVAILPDIDQDHLIIKNVLKAVKKGGTVLFVLPALESALLTAYRITEWCNDQGSKVRGISKNEYAHLSDSVKDIAQGLIKLDGMPTKHYLERELEALVNANGCKITAIERLEYPWTTEFETPPKWMRDPYPFDWLIEIKS